MEGGEVAGGEVAGGDVAGGEVAGGDVAGVAAWDDADDVVVIGLPDGLNTHHKPNASLTPCPFAWPGPVSGAKVYRGQPA